MPKHDAGAVNRTRDPSRATGLSTAEATVRLERDGANDVPEKRVHPIGQFLRKFIATAAGRAGRLHRELRTYLLAGTERPDQGAALIVRFRTKPGISAVVDEAPRPHRQPD